MKLFFKALAAIAILIAIGYGYRFIIRITAEEASIGWHKGTETYHLNNLSEEDKAIDKEFDELTKEKPEEK